MSRSLRACLLGPCLFFLACHDAGSGEHAASRSDARVLDVAPLDAALGGLDATVLDASSRADAGRGVDFRRPTNEASQCPVVREPAFRTHVLLDVADLGSGAQLMTLSGAYVLVQGGSEPFRLLRVGTSDAPAPKSWSFPGGLRGLAVAAATGSGTLVLACTSQSAGCSLLLAQDAETSLVQVAASDLPAAFVARGLGIIDAQPCAFGSSLICFAQGAWTTLIGSLAPDDEFAALAGDAQSSIAVSKLGRVFRVQAGNAVSELTQVDPGVIAASLSGGQGFVLAPDSLWCVNDATLSPCSTIAGAQAALVDLGGESAAVLDRGNDLLLRRAPGDWCHDSQLILSGPVLAADAAPCGAASNFRVLTSRQVIGQNVCLEVP